MPLKTEAPLFTRSRLNQLKSGISGIRCARESRINASLMLAVAFQRVEMEWNPPQCFTSHGHQLALITGGSRGIGRAIATEFAAQGHALCLVARHRDSLQQAAQELMREFGVPVTTYAIDVAAPNAAERLQWAVARDGLSVKYLVNNAACWTSGNIELTDLEDLEQAIATNILAPVRLAKVFLPQLSAARGGVLWISSIAALMPAPALATYGASKAFIRAFSIAMSSECRDRNIRSCVALPGFVDTGFVSSNRRPIWHQLCATSPETVARAAYRGLATGQETVVPGLLNRLMYFGLRNLPDPLVEPLLSMVSRRYH